MDNNVTPIVNPDLPMLDVDTPLESVLAIYMRMQIAQLQLREWREKIETAMIEWINANGDIEVGDIRYYVGPEKTVKCLDVKATLEALLTITEGDFDRVAGCLSSGAIKPGAARDVLADQFEKHFSTTVKQDLKTGKPVKSLHVVNKKFVK